MDLYYLLLWLSIYILSFLHFSGVVKYNDYLMNAMLVIWAFFVGFRFEIGADWWNYSSFFYSGIASDKSTGTYEPLFGAVRWVIYRLGFRHEIFFFVLSFFSLYLIKYTAKKLRIDNVYMVFLIYISMFFCFYQLNIVRSGIMASCIWMAFVQKKEGKGKGFIIWSLIATGFHAVALVLVPIIWFCDKKYTSFWVFILLGMAYLVMVTGVGKTIVSSIPLLNAIDRLAGYIDPANIREKGFSIGSAFNLLFFLYLYTSRKGLYETNVNYRMIINVFAWGIFTVNFFSAIGMVATRVGQVLNMSLIFIWPYFISLIKRKDIAFVVLLVMTAYLLMFYTQAFRPNEILGYSLIYPYKYQFEGFFR